MEQQYITILRRFKGVSTLKTKKRINTAYQQLMSDVRGMVHDNGYTLCTSVMSEVEKEADVVFEDKHRSAETVITAVLMGLLYPGAWTLDKATDNILSRLQALVESVQQEGDLSKILDPNKVYQRTAEGVYITRVDGETQRLVRTTVEHIFQEAVAESANEVHRQTGSRVMIRWVSALAENTCDVCASRHNELYEPSELPLEHPNGQCDFYIEIY